MISFLALLTQATAQVSVSEAQSSDGKGAALVRRLVLFPPGQSLFELPQAFVRTVFFAKTTALRSPFLKVYRSHPRLPTQDRSSTTPEVTPALIPLQAARRGCRSETQPRSFPSR